MVQDAVFCFQASESANIARDREQDPAIKSFLAKIQTAYTGFVHVARIK